MRNSCAMQNRMAGLQGLVLVKRAVFAHMLNISGAHFSSHWRP